jgi:cytochrome c5
MRPSALTVLTSIASCICILAAAVPLSACSGSASTTSTITWGDLQKNGAPEFGSICSACHGKTGGGGFGPPVLGNNANLWKYYTAKGLLDFLSIAMPFNAPGSLTPQQYLNDMGFLLVGNGYASTGQLFVEKDLVHFTLPEPTAPPA